MNTGEYEDDIGGTSYNCNVVKSRQSERTPVRFLPLFRGCFSSHLKVTGKDPTGERCENKLRSRWHLA